MLNNKYKLEKMTGDNEARFLFDGPFEHKIVTWHAHLVTCKHFNHLSQSPDTETPRFIDITPSAETGHYNIKICLDINHITKAEILKTIIMVRQYKKLAPGKHKFG